MLQTKFFLLRFMAQAWNAQAIHNVKKARFCNLQYRPRKTRSARCLLYLWVKIEAGKISIQVEWPLMIDVHQILTQCSRYVHNISINLLFEKPFKLSPLIFCLFTVFDDLLSTFIMDGHLSLFAVCLLQKNSKNPTRKFGSFALFPHLCSFSEVCSKFFFKTHFGNQNKLLHLVGHTMKYSLQNGPIKSHVLTERYNNPKYAELHFQ